MRSSELRNKEAIQRYSVYKKVLSLKGKKFKWGLNTSVKEKSQLCQQIDFLFLFNNINAFKHAEAARFTPRRGSN